MPIHTRMLLGLRPDHALVRMLNDENNRKFPANGFKFDLPVAYSTTDPTLTRVKFTTNRLAVDDNTNLPYTGSLHFRYHRVDLTQQFRAILNGFRPTIPTSTKVLLNEITRITGIKFYDEDIVLEEITRENAYPYRIKAKTESLRFIGHIDVELIDLVDLNIYLDDGLTTTTFGFSSVPQLRSLDINTPFINATPLLGQGLVRQFENHTWSYDVSTLGTLLRKTVPVPGKCIDQTPALDWVNSATPAPWNYYGADVDVRTGVTSTNMFLPRLDRLIEVTLKAGRVSNLDDLVIRIPYRRFVEEESAFATTGRLRSPATYSVTNATPWNKQMNLLQVGQVLSPPNFEIFNFEIIPGEVWNFWPEPNPVNLRDSVVQYNGEIQRYMAQPLDTTLNRVVILTLSEYNTTYSGNHPIFYRAPITVNTEIGNVSTGESFDFDFAPTDGRAPYVVSLESGEFAPGHTITANHLTGTSNTLGTYSGVIKVVDGDNVTVYQSFTYKVVN